MTPAIDYAYQCLSMYLERGLKAQVLLESGDDEKALECLKWRRAAFLNFCFYDEIVTQERADYLNEARFVEIWREIRSCDNLLEEQMSTRFNQFNNGLKKIFKARMHLKRFHSGQKASSGYVGSV
jgi:hypothetical protein